MHNKINEFSTYIENVTLLILGVTLLSFPLLFTPDMLDNFGLPKQVLIAGAVAISLLLYCAKMLSESVVRIRRTPFDIPVLLFGIVILLSSFFSLNRIDALITSVPLIFALLAYFAIVNTAKTTSSVLFLLSCFLIGASLVSILGILSFFKIYPLPFQLSQTQLFSPLGSLLDQAVYIGSALIMAVLFLAPLLQSKNVSQHLNKTVGFAVATLILLLGLSTTLYELVILQKPIILPFTAGFQTAFAAISQDSGRLIQGFLLGSGFGTYATDFTRFKQATINSDPTLWSFTFFRSSSFILELLATTGFLGVSTFVLLLIRIFKSVSWSDKKKNPVYLALIALGVLAFILPFSFVIASLFFFMLGLYGAYQGLFSTHTFFDVDLHFVAFKKSTIPFSTYPVDPAVRSEHDVAHLSPTEKAFTRVLPIILSIVIVLFLLPVAIYAYRYVTSDITFQDSLVAASANNGNQTYQLQSAAIATFPERDAYRRVFSQTNLALANSLASQQPQGSSPSAQTQQTIVTLIQQSINEGRTATDLSPLTVANWQNLASVYRSLIGFGQNAENFAILATQQAIALDPNNPQNYLNLGGLYYQLQQWDEAQRQFQIAVNLKPDLANAYYNLGHALEAKGDLPSALIQYQTVEGLVRSNAENLKSIQKEIAELQKKIGSAQQTTPQTAAQTQDSALQNQPPLQLNSPSSSLPQQTNPVKIPPPTTATDSAR